MLKSLIEAYCSVSEDRPLLAGHGRSVDGLNPTLCGRSYFVVQNIPASGILLTDQRRVALQKLLLDLYGLGRVHAAPAVQLQPARPTDMAFDNRD